jgi:ribonuclease P protein component
MRSLLLNRQSSIKKITDKEVYCETYISTKQTPPFLRTWILKADELGKWSQNHQQAPQTRTQAINTRLAFIFPKSMRLRTRSEYRRMTQKTIKFVGQWIVADIRLTKLPFSRLGITVTKRYGKAHDRNRFKRIVREAFRLSFPHFSEKLDILIRPRSQAVGVKMGEVQKELLSFVQRACSNRPLA